MRRLTYLLSSIAALALLSTGPSVAAATAPPALVDQHWSIVGLGPERTIQLRVLVANEGSSPLMYRVRFTAEWAEAATLAAAPVDEMQGGSAVPLATAAWRPVQVLVVRGGPLAPGASDGIAEELPADILQAPKAYRFRAELVDGNSGEVLAETFVTKRNDGPPAWLPGALAAVLTGNAAGPGSSHERPDPLTGSGTMVGTHEARRVGSEWVEHGWGVITVTGHNFRMVIDYTYDSRGPNAASLSATGAGVGTVTRPGRPSLPVNITSATAAISVAGDRHQSGSVVTRTHCAATGTFDGMAGDERYRGTITMTNGTQTLDLTTHRGDHRFDIQFTAVR